MERFRFIHAADLHLEQPISGLREIPLAMRNALARAPQLATQNVFQFAIDQKVDFVILSGDIIDPEIAGPQAIAFLVDEFEKLNENNISIYWLPAETSDSGWPAGVDLPANVYRFAHKSVDTVQHSTAMTITGFSGISPSRIRTKDLPRVDSSTWSVVVGHGEAVPKAAAKCEVHYWAFGGSHESDQQDNFHFAGTPQGRGAHEPGPRGCKLVTTAHDGTCEVELIESDVVRWQTETIEIGSANSLDDIKERVGNRVLTLSEQTGPPCIVTLRLLGIQSLETPLRLSSLSTDLLDWIHQEFSEISSQIWVDSVACDAPTEFPETWEHEDTLLGGFLGTLSEIRDDESIEIELGEFLSEEMAGSLSSAIRLTDSEKRREILNDALLLGVDLMRGKDVA